MCYCSDLTLHFDLLNATRVEIYIVIKAKINFSNFSIFLYSLITAECFHRIAEPVKHGFCTSSLHCLFLTGAFQWNVHYLCCSAAGFYAEPFKTERVYWGRQGQDLGSGCFGTWEQHVGAKSNQMGTGANWSSQESYPTPELLESSFCLIPSVT